MVGGSENLCFQACVAVTRKTHYDTNEKFNAAAEELEIDFGDNYHAQIPKKDYMEEIFPPGHLVNLKDLRYISLLNAQNLLTIAPYKLTNDDPELSNASDDLKKIMEQYVSAIEDCYPELNFEDRNYSDITNLSVEFRFIVQPYNPQLCHPLNLGVLKPITIIGEQPVHPISHEIRL